MSGFVLEKRVRGRQQRSGNCFKAIFAVCDKGCHPARPRPQTPDICCCMFGCPCLQTSVFLSIMCRDWRVGGSMKECFALTQLLFSLTRVTGHRWMCYSRLTSINGRIMVQDKHVPTRAYASHFLLY